MKLLRVLPFIAVVVITVLAATAMSSLSQFNAAIDNPTNQVQAGSVSLNENSVCPTPGDGQWHDCGATNKFGGGPPLASSQSRSTPVTVTNTGSSRAQLFLLPLPCSDSLTGARGALCDAVTVQVVCNGLTVVPTMTLNAFHDGRNFPTGYPVGTLAGGAGASCAFTVTAGSIPAAGTVSQPIAWKLTAGS